MNSKRNQTPNLIRDNQCNLSVQANNDQQLLELKFNNFNKQINNYRQRGVSEKKDYVTKILGKLDFNLLNDIKIKLMHLKLYQGLISYKEFMKMCNPKSSQFSDDNMLKQEIKNQQDQQTLKLNISDILHKLNQIKQSRKSINGDDFEINQSDLLNQLIKTSLWKTNLNFQSHQQQTKLENKIHKMIKIKKTSDKSNYVPQYMVQDIDRYIEMISNSGKKISQSLLQQIVFDSQDRKNSSPNKQYFFEQISQQKKTNQIISFVQINGINQVKKPFKNNSYQNKNFRSQSHNYQYSNSVETSPLLNINNIFDSDDDQKKKFNQKYMNKPQFVQYYQQQKQSFQQQNQLKELMIVQKSYQKSTYSQDDKMNQQQSYQQQQLQNQLQSSSNQDYNNNQLLQMISSNNKQQFQNQQNHKIQNNISLTKQNEEYKKKLSYERISAWENDQFQDEEW